MKMVAHDIQTEAVDRRDLRVMDERQLAQQMFISRVLIKSLLNRISDSLPHLRRRCIRKSHD